MNKLPSLYITITTWFSECIHNCNTIANPCVLTCWQAKINVLVVAVIDTAWIQTPLSLIKNIEE